MNKFICCPQELIPDEIENGVEYFSLYSSVKPRQEGVGHIALQLQRDVRKAGVIPSVQSWDFTTIALSVAAADDACPRSRSADGWTRQIEMIIYLHEPSIWQAQRKNIESTLRFLTGDFWKFTFVSGGIAPPKPSRKQVKTYEADCVSLLSGGVDSLVGAIDLTAEGKHPLFVSKIVTGDKDIQKKIAKKLGATDRYFQWSFNSRSSNESESSTRGRSIIFFAFAALAASALKSNIRGTVPIYVPENGFISLNVALNPSRMGSLSTKTTHPVYIDGLQKLWDAVGIDAQLIFPHDYQFKTKGELLEGCLDRQTLKDLISDSTSCGKYGRHKKTHCGRCIPCLVRRASFLKSGLTDTTSISTAYQRQYVFMNLATALSEKSSIDIRAAAGAYLRYKEQGINRFIGGSLSFAAPSERSKYEGVVARGLEEIGQLLIQHGVI